MLSALLQNKRCAFSGGLPYPAGEDRDAWRRVNDADELCRAADEAMRSPYPVLLASDFMAYALAGDRQAFERPYFARRHHLIRTAVGECLAWDGRYMQDVADGLWLLCEESTWVVSAHNVDVHPGSPTARERPLPDKDNPVIDLFAAQTAATITLCCHLLGDRLDALAPMLIRRMRREVYERVLTPFYQRDDFWWMGIVRTDINNWTPWILSNILICLLHWEKDAHRLREGIGRVMAMLDRYIGVMPDDGGCDEGVSYWNMAGASLMDCLDLLHYASNGEVNVYEDEKIRRIACFPAEAHIAGRYFWSFADCDAVPRLDAPRIWRIGQTMRHEGMTRLGAHLLNGQRPVWPQDTPQMARVLDALFLPPVASEAMAQGDRTIMLPDLQVWASRRGALYAAVKAGHNGENHNHNDVGGFLLYVNGQPAVVDAGNMLYTAKTFSDERYTLWNTRSENHNVPLIGGVEQSAGSACRAEQVRMDEGGIELDMRSAYPRAAGLLSARRGARMRGGAFVLSDEITLSRADAVEWVFMLRARPKVTEGRCVAGCLAISFPGHLSWRTEECPMTDARMARSFPGSLWRLVLKSAPTTHHEAVFSMEEYHGQSSKHESPQN